MKHNFIIILSSIFILFCSYIFIDITRATSWPENYKEIFIDDQNDAKTDDAVIIDSDQLDITKFWTVNNSGANGYPAGFYVKFQMNDIGSVDKGSCFETHWNPSDNSNLFYKVVFCADVISQQGKKGKIINTPVYAIAFWKSINQGANWTKSVEHTNINSEDWNLAGNSLGYRIKKVNNGFVEMRINESLFAPVSAIYNIYAKTTFGSPPINMDRCPNLDAILYTLSYNAFATQWPGATVYTNRNAYLDGSKDINKIPKEQQEIFEGQFTDAYHDIFARVKLQTVSETPAIGINTRVYFNHQDAKYANIWYMFESEYTGSNKWDILLKRSVDNKNTWTILEGYSKVNLINGQYNSGTLGFKITTGSPGHIEWYTKKTYIEEPAASLKIFYETVFSLNNEAIDKALDFDIALGNLSSRAIRQLTIDPPNLAPAEVDQGEINVPMTRLTASTTTSTVEWLGLRIDKTSSSTMSDVDVAGIKLWKDDGDQIFETDQDMVVADAKNNPFSFGTANITLNPTQILTGVNFYYFITYDIDWFAGLDRTVGMYIGDKTYFTVLAPDNVSIEYFPFIAGNSKITSAGYLSFNIFGVDENINTEGETTDISTGGSGWIDFGSLTPNLSIVAGQKLNIMTNSATGYKVTIQENNNLTNLENNNTVPDILGTNAVPSVWPSAGGFGYHTSDDLLSSGTTNRFLPDNTYASVTNAPEEVAYKNSATSENGDAIDIVYKLEIDSLQAVGKYVNTITYTCTTMY